MTAPKRRSSDTGFNAWVSGFLKGFGDPKSPQLLITVLATVVSVFIAGLALDGRQDRAEVRMDRLAERITKVGNKQGDIEHKQNDLNRAIEKAVERGIKRGVKIVIRRIREDL